MLSNGSERLRNAIQWHLNSFFSEKLQKIAQQLEASPPDPQNLRRLGAPPPDPVCDTFELH